MDSYLIIIFVSLLSVLLILSAVFSAAETAYSSLSKSKIQVKVDKGSKTAKLILKHYNTFGKTLATILICNNLVNIASSAIITLLLTKLLGATATTSIVSTAIMTPLIVIFGEIIPKLLAKRYPYGYLSKIIYFLEIFNILFFPFTYFIAKIPFQSNVTNSETELKSLIKLARKEGVLENNEATLASNALDLDSTQVSKVMTKRKDVITIKSTSTIGQSFKLFQKHGFSRLPVKKDNKIIGVILLKDVFFKDKEEKIENYILDIPHVSQYMLCTKALEDMRANQSHFALVTETKEKERVVGIVTVEDIIEELVGEIYDEHDEMLSIREISHSKWVANGSEKLSVLEKEIGYKFEYDDKDMSIKQFIQSRIRRKIKEGLVYLYSDKIQFKVLSNKNKTETILEIMKK